MKINLKTLLLVYTALFLCLNLVRCANLGKIAPEYRGVDPKLEHFVKEFKELAEMQGITFKHGVSMGFKKLGGTTVGLTTYGRSFREIDIDTEFFNNSTEITRNTLVWHELVHAYCYRGHTWGYGRVYPEYSEWHGKEPKEGRYKDGSRCPLSIMYPSVLDDFCLLIHYGDYTTEMFRNCRPY
jgi:hypothetical protein